jgi:hypothetical protein
VTALHYKQQVSVQSYRPYGIVHKKNGLDQYCGSGMFVPDPGSWFLSIPDRIPKPTTATKMGEKKISFPTFFVATNWKLLYFWTGNGKQFTEFFPNKLSLSSQKYRFWIRDQIREPGSGINLFRIRDPGVQKVPDPGSPTLASTPLRRSECSSV